MKMSLIRKHDKSLDLHISRSDLQRIYNYQLMKIKGVMPKRRREIAKKEKKVPQPFQLPSQLYHFNPTTNKYHAMSTTLRLCRGAVRQLSQSDQQATGKKGEGSHTYIEKQEGGDCRCEAGDDHPVE